MASASARCKRPSRSTLCSAGWAMRASAPRPSMPMPAATEEAVFAEKFWQMGAKSRIRTRVRTGRKGNYPSSRPQGGKVAFDRLKQWAANIKRDAHALYLAARDPRVSWYTKLLAIAVAAYALSPIDLIPDFIPVLGYLDDLVIVPLGILLVVSLIPKEIMAEHRQTATRRRVAPRKPRRRCWRSLLYGSPIDGRPPGAPTRGSVADPCGTRWPQSKANRIFDHGVQGCGPWRAGRGTALQGESEHLPCPSIGAEVDGPRAQTRRRRSTDAGGERSRISPQAPGIYIEGRRRLITERGAHPDGPPRSYPCAIRPTVGGRVPLLLATPIVATSTCSPLVHLAQLSAAALSPAAAALSYQLRAECTVLRPS